MQCHLLDPNVVEALTVTDDAVTEVVIIDHDGVLGPFASTAIGEQTVTFVPGLVVVGKDDVVPPDLSFGFVILRSGVSNDWLNRHSRLFGPDRPFMITCVNRQTPAAANHGWAPDIVVFDESFVRRHVPFGAFTARKSLFQHWNRKGFTTFHSTTFQPNTIASLHFLRCLERDDPTFFGQMAKHLERIRQDRAYRKSLFARLYSPSLARATAAGTFRWPATQVVPMYDSRFSGLSPSSVCVVSGE